MSPSERGRPDYSPVVLVGQIGIVAAVPIVVGVAAGIYLQERWGGVAGGMCLVGGILFGVVGAGVGVYRIVAPFLK